MIGQLAPAGSEDWQTLVCAKSPAFVPVIVMLLMFSGLFPLLVNCSLKGGLVVFTAWA